MQIQRLKSNQRMSQIVTAGNTLYLAGQVASDATADVAGQTRDILDKIEALLAEAGSNKQQLLSVTIYLRDMKDFAAMNEVWDSWVEAGHAPARACVEARLARAELLVEMSVTALIAD